MGLINPIFINQEINLFYFIADYVGISVMFFSLIYLNYMFYIGVIEIEWITNLLVKSTLYISLGTIITFFLFKGNKVSTPQEIHFGLATIISLSSIHGIANSYFKLSKLNFLLLIVSAILSQLRMNLIIIIFSFLAINLKTIFKNPIRAFYLFIISFSIAYILIYFTGDIATERISTIIDMVDQDNYEDGLVERSANQRILEATLILEEFQKQNYWIKFFGKGFGAHYKNIGGLVTHYPEWVHNSHITIFSILIRNGFFGVLLFLTPILMALWKYATSSKTIQIVQSVILISFYLALMSDQYVYWGFLYALSLSMFFSAKEKYNSKV